jgi:biotin operon repressor
MSKKLRWLGKNQKTIIGILSDGTIHSTEELMEKLETSRLSVYDAIKRLRWRGVDIAVKKGVGYFNGDAKNIPLSYHTEYATETLGRAIGAERRLVIHRPSYKAALRREISTKGRKNIATLTAAKNVFKKVVEHTTALEMADLAEPKRLTA